MSINSSSSFGVAPIPPLNSSSNSSIFSLYFDCQQSLPSDVIYTLCTVINTFLLLPLYIFTLYVGYQRWGKQTTSHSDFFTYHMVVMEISGVFGSLFYHLGAHTDSESILMLGVLVACVIFPGQTLFHCLTCVERYLAVVHPVTYMHLRETAGGVRIRNTSIACAWLLCFGWVGLTAMYWPGFPVMPLLGMLGVSVVLIFFCCVSVLCVLTHPGPGEVGGDKGGAGQSKQRALHIIWAILAVLLLRCLGLLLIFSLENLKSTHRDLLCALIDFGFCLCLPSSLVLPLLFLHKAGKLACCRNKTASG